MVGLPVVIVPVLSNTTVETCSSHIDTGDFKTPVHLNLVSGHFDGGVWEDHHPLLARKSCRHLRLVAENLSGTKSSIEVRRP